MYRLLFSFLLSLFFLSSYSHANSIRVDRFASPYIEEPLGTFPWIVKVNSDAWQCSGFLASNKHVITAAHCLGKNGENSKKPGH